MEDKQLDYLKILIALEDMPFGIGKNLLIDFLSGNEGNESVKRNRLHKLELFGYFALCEKNEISDMIENLLLNGLLEYKPLPHNQFVKVLELTEKGRKEIIEPMLYKKKLSNNFRIVKTVITEEDRIAFEAFDFFLNGYNDDQKKAVISRNSRILCIAGAGSGKTTVLTKRIEFLTTFKSIPPEKILAITFTRKARREMESRLSKSGYCNGVMVETFNSFCEKIIKKHDSLIYSRKTRMMSYSDRINIFKTALRENKIDVGEAINNYFSYRQKEDKTTDELAKMLMNDCYSVIEIYKMNSISLENLREHNDLDFDDQKNLDLVYKICKFIHSFMEKFGLRDYSDQIIDCIKFFREHKEYIPNFEHVLVDEYQDVNLLQVEILELLNAENLFCVGDPRQSIFGWRGSKIGYILNFEEKYPECEIITLSSNYRSGRKIVDLINKSLEGIKLPDLIPQLEASSDIELHDFDSEDEEMNYVMGKIQELGIPRNEIFVLARTNRMINELSQRMRIKGINHLVRTEETPKEDEAGNEEITLATIHSIKGMEASAVFVIGCNSSNFPCKGSEHPVIEFVKVDDYDKEEEEKRLFYVALSRAKRSLFLTYSGKNPTRFINEHMHKLMKKGEGQSRITEANNLSKTSKAFDALSRLKAWRRETAEKNNVAAFVIMHDKTLFEIVEMNPIDVEDLRNIYGMGKSKIERYGKEIIDVLNGK